MRRLLTAFVLASPAPVMAVETAAPPKQGLQMPALAMLPPGSELKGVMLPRYDENNKLVGVLKSEKIILVSSDQIAGTGIVIEMFNPDQTPRGRIDLARATYDQAKGLVSSDEPVAINSGRMTANGQGFYYFFPTGGQGAGPARGKGFLLGPATTTISPVPTETSMNAPTSPLRATALLGMTLISQPLQAAPHPEITAAEKAAVEADASSKAGVVHEAGSAARHRLEKDLADSAAASNAAATFLVQADIPPVQAAPQPAAKPLEVTPDPSDTVIHCEGGMYFDPDAGVLVYLKNVTVKDPRFDLSGTVNELKVFFAKPPADEKSADKKDTAKPDKVAAGFGGFGGKFGDVERIVATGAVVLDQKPADGGKDPIKASGAIFSYNLKEDQIILSGGFPWVMQGKNKMRAKEANLSLRISPKAGTFVTEGGNWDTFLNLEQKKK